MAQVQKKEEAIDNKGLLNGNFINNGQIGEIDSDLVNIERLMYILIVIMVLKLAISVLGMYVKKQKKKSIRNQRLDSIIVPRNA